MLKSYLKLAFRNISRSASYSIINVSGLALGITCALLIFSLVTYHLNFDDFHSDSERIYRFVTEQHRDQVTYVGSVPPAFGKAFRDDYTYGEKVARLYTAHDALISVEHGNDLIKFTENAAFADPEFFDIFNFPLLSGGSSKVLTDPNTAILTQGMAKKLFGDESPLNKIIRLNNGIDFKVTGVLKDIPDNTDLRSEIYLSYSTVKQYNEWSAADDSWGGITTEIETFGKLRLGVTPEEVEAALPAYVKKYRPQSKNVHHYKLQPLNDMHFNAHYGGVMEMKTLLVLSVIGFFLVFTACLNFINLATAQAITRSKEVGVRKTLGGARTQLFWQFTLETSVIVVIASIVAFGVAYAVLPFVNQLFSTRVQFNLLTDVRLILFMPMLMGIVTLLSCFYPGMVLSGFKPVQALKGKLTTTANFNLRRSLITVQFTISQVLLIGLIVVVYQMKYFKDTDMGFNQDAIVMIPSGSNDEKMKTLKEKLAQIPHVESVSSCFSSPSSQYRWGTSVFFDKSLEQEDFAVSFRGADENYLSTFGISLVAGRNLFPSDTVREFLINETFAGKLNLSAEDILGKTMRLNGTWEGPIVGIVKDFHDLSLHEDISPVFLSTSIEHYHAYAVKINMQDSKATLAALEKAWTEMYPELIYNYDFVDDLTAEFYQTEETMLKLVEVFSFIALFIGCMGLYGMASFMAVQKTKEIGIRKVLGGSITHILWIFGKEFSVLIIVAFLLAAPMGWFLMSGWLENYAYHIDMNAWIFVAEIAVIAAVVLLTVGYKALRSAFMNPVKALRTE
ncbi:MAG TPA: ABC transporter permease [Chryseolinea sp.]|nr:ABC transporter permease [Chryseolinea sp.]